MFGQKAPLKQSIFFETAKYDLSKESKKTLDGLLDSLKQYQTYKIYISGNTDAVGDSAYNAALSAHRVESVRSYFVRKGISPNSFSTKAFGENRPIANNATEEGKQKNRRVDVIISYTRKPAVDSSQFVPSIGELYKKLETKPQEFCIRPDKDTVIRCAQGTLVYFKANSFEVKRGCSCVTIKVKEDFLKSDMILDNLSTTSNGRLIETQGMVYTEADDCNGRKIGLLRGKQAVILVPADTIVAASKVFQGARTPHDSVMNWTVNNSSVLRNFTLKELELCSEIIHEGIAQCQRCKFFFCRILRFPEGIKGAFDEGAHRWNVEFRKCQRNLRHGERLARKYQRDMRRAEKAFSKFQQQNREKNKQGNKPDSIISLLPKCQYLKDLFKQYCVNDIVSLINAINKPLIDSFGVKNVSELTDTLRKLNLANLEMAYRNKKISFDDFKYYIYNTSKLGWSNIDCFANYPKDSLVTLKVNLKVSPNVDCKLVYKDKNYIIPPDRLEGNYEFKNIPKGQALLVALKYEEGKPYLSMQEITVEDKMYDVSFRSLTLDELKQELLKLNR
jgi:hypothetical protein